MNKKIINKKSNGITLISLVITIVIMLILATVSINLIIGNGGLFSKTNQSKDKYVESADMEKIEHVWDEYVTDEAEKDYTQELTLVRFSTYAKDNNLLNITSEQENELEIKVNNNSYNVEKSDSGLSIIKKDTVSNPEETNKLLLYDEGNEYNSITGGIVIYNANGLKDTVSGSDRGTSWNRKENSIVLSGQSISGDGGSGYICMETNNLIDTTGYKTLHVKVLQSGYSSVGICSKAGVSENLGLPIYSGGGVGGVYSDYIAQNGEIDITFDLTSYQGNYRLFLEIFHGDCHYAPISNEVTQMWIEK